ncbi:MAG TPA: cyclic nucleotide-binding domain-containing protein [Thermoflexia bacterium]|nr:cyclic nucleotide-binding domain-containing protein [Thermoflexia bacterium]
MDGSPISSQKDIEGFFLSLLSDLEEDDLRELAEAAEVRFLPPGTVICREGDEGDAVYAIVEGELEILQQLDDENERHLHYTGPGEFVGEMAILKQGARSATVRTSQPTTIIEIGRESFMKVLKRSPTLGFRLLVRLTDRLRDSDQQAIAELRRANEELTCALKQLARIDKTKTDFIQVSAHELRTPVASLLGYAQMLSDNSNVQENPQLQVLTEGIVTGTKRLHRVFNSILDVSRVMTDGLEIRRSPVSMAVIFDGVAVELGPALEERGLTLEQEGLGSLPIYSGDPDLLYKAFYQLVNNGIKYTPNGGRIKASGQVIESPDLGQCIEIVIEDTGIGIAPEDLDLIFAKFYRTGEVALHSSSTTKFKGGGPGLGLTIAQGTVLAHGGLIWAESPGYDEETCPGSRFVVQLPLNQPAMEASADSSPEGAR